jgi:8-oxo-dGTP pyrophosphatase MutT (NUDIX family)
MVVHGGHVLAITRGYDMADLSLPGGKLEDGESFGHAAIRELWEETRVDASRSRLVPVIHRRTAEEESVSYLVVGPVRFPSIMYSDPFEGFVRWATPVEMLGSGCTYRDVNRIAFKKVGLI